MAEYFGRNGKNFTIPTSYNQTNLLETFDGVKVIAKGYWTSAGFLLVAGSLIRRSITLKSNPGVIDTRNKLLQKSLLVPISNNTDFYLLREDILLSSPSTASRLVHGNDRNGWTDWKCSGVALGTLLH